MKSYNTIIPICNYDPINKKFVDAGKETTTPETLHNYSFYGRTETHNAPLRLFAIGGRLINNFCSNFDIYADRKGTLYSIPREGSGCRGTFFGDVNHVKNLIREGCFSYTLTEYGFAMMKGGRK